LNYLPARQTRGKAQMPDTMKKAVITGPKRIEIIDVDVPKPGPGQVLVKVLSIGICGSDLHYYAGDQIGDRDISYPMSLGHEFAGDIAQVGPGVTSVKPGDRILAEPALGCGECEWCKAGRINLCPECKFCGSPPVDGALSQYYILDERQAVKIPDDMSYDSALMAEPLANLIHAFGMCRFEPADTVSIIGCGPIGLLLLQLVRRAGPSEIFVAEKVGYRLEHARRLGADVCIDAAEKDAAEEILAATGGRGVDLAVEAAGDVQAIGQCIEVAKRGGFVLIEGIPGETTIPFDIRTARRKELTVQLCRRCPDPPHKALTMIHDKTIDVDSLITHHFPIGESAGAYRLVYDYTEGAVKVIVNPWSEKMHSPAG